MVWIVTLWQYASSDVTTWVNKSLCSIRDAVGQPRNPLCTICSTQTQLQGKYNYGKASDKTDSGRQLTCHTATIRQDHHTIHKEVGSCSP